MEIKASCKYDLNAMKAFTRRSMYIKANPKSRMIVTTILYSILMLLVVFCLIVVGHNSTLYTILGLCVLALLWLYFTYFLSPIIKYNAQVKMKDAKNEYIFYDDMIKASTEGDEFNGETKIEYSLFVKAYETNEYFFIYITKRQAFMVDKSTIEGGTAADIRKKLIFYLGDKYIVCNY